MNISFEHSLAWLWLIVPAVTLVVVWLYYFRKKEVEWTERLRFVMASLRWVVLAVLALLLLVPSIIHLIEEEEKPRLLIYADRSASISPAEQTGVEAFIAAATERLAPVYDVRAMYFGGDVMAGAASEVDTLYTDLGAVARSVTEDFYGEHIGAVVVASDGIQNKGSDPRYVPIGNTAALYAITLGDTSVLADLEVAEVLSNRLAFLNNEFEIKTRLVASKLDGKTAKVKLLHHGKELAVQQVDIDAREFSTELSFITTASSLGLTRYTVSVDVVEGERNALNNTADTYIDVLDNRTKVTMLSAAPHPDLAFIKRSVEESDQYEVETLLLRDWDGKTDGADLYILHGLPENANDLNRIHPILRDGKPTWSIVTPRVSYRHFNALDLGLTIEAGQHQRDEVSGALNPDFNLFNIDENPALKRYPPLQAPFGNFILSTDHQLLLAQSVGNILTEKPLAVYLNRDGKKDGLFIGDGLWKWNLFEANIGDQGWTKTLVQKTVQYLAIKQKRSRLDVSAPRKVEERQDVVFNAAYYNQSYELNNDPEVQLFVTDSSGNTTEYRFKPTSNAYRTSLGALPPGVYTWRATVAVAGERFEQNGVFTVMRNRAEFMRSVADHRLLADWADRKGGGAYDLSQQEALLEQLANLDNARPVIHTSKEWLAVVEWKWLLFTLVLLLSIEWFIRKYTGYV